MPFSWGFIMFCAVTLYNGYSRFLWRKSGIDYPDSKEISESDTGNWGTIRLRERVLGVLQWTEDNDKALWEYPEWAVVNDPYSSAQQNKGSLVS